MLNAVDKFIHGCLALRVTRRLRALDVIDVLTDLIIRRGVLSRICSDSGAPSLRPLPSPAALFPVLPVSKCSALVLGRQRIITARSH